MISKLSTDGNVPHTVTSNLPCFISPDNRQLRAAVTSTMPMTTRPRRTIVPSRRRLDMEMDSDVDMEDQPEPEEEDRENDNDNGNDNEDPEPEEEDAPAADEAAAEDDNDGDDDIDEDEDDEDDQEDEIQSENDGEESQPAPSSHLRIRLKMPAPASRSAGTETPGVESEDSMDSHPSTSTAAKPMTTRQAVLASMVDSTHVSLGGRQSKKKVLNESEIALRREETARKRKNMTEKKLEDEKVHDCYFASHGVGSRYLS